MTENEAKENGLNVGTIEGIHGLAGSGIATIIIDGEAVYADNGPLIRALDDCFRNVIGPGHTFDATHIIGKRIAWSYDDMGLTLEGFTPIDEE